MDTQEMVTMEFKKDVEAADSEPMKQDHLIIREVVVETSDNNGQAEAHNQVSNNQQHQAPARHLPPQQQKGSAAVELQIPPEQSLISGRPTQQWAAKDEGEERVPIASGPQPITVITAPKTRMINSSGNIREITAEESEAAGQKYEEMINQQSQAVESNGLNSSHPYSVAETMPTTSIATSVSNISGGQILVATREIINDKDQICINNQLIPHPEHNSSTIYHEQGHAGDVEPSYRSEYYTQYSDHRPGHGTIINRDGHAVASYGNTYRYVGSPGRVVTTTTELKPIQMEDQQQVSQEIQLYNESEVVQNSAIPNGQGHLNVEPNMESKLHYTNLDANYISQEHYTSAYAPPTNSGISKDYIFAPTGNVLYKSGEINRNFTDALLANHHRQPFLYTSLPMSQPIYESSSSGGGPSSSGQPPRFHSNQPYYNFEGFNQVIIENDMPTEYQSNWTTSAPTGYEDHSPVTTISTTMPQVTKCIHCGSQTASYYRTDQSGHLICNTCTSRSGLPPISRPPNRSTKAKTAQTTVNNNRRTGVVCANCNTSTTTLWRRNNSGDPVCNACGLYYKLHNTPRPIAMKKDGVQTRKRKPKNVPNNGNSAKCQVRDKVLPSMISAPEPKMINAGETDISPGVAVTEQPTTQQHYLPVHGQAPGYIVRPMRHVSPNAGAVDTSRSGAAETTSVITSTGAPSGP